MIQLFSTSARDLNIRSQIILKTAKIISWPGEDTSWITCETSPFTTHKHKLSPEEQFNCFNLSIVELFI